MQKTGSLEPNVYESTLHTRQDPHDSTQINIPNQSSSNKTFDENILKFVVHQNGNSSFSRSCID